MKDFQICVILIVLWLCQFGYSQTQPGIQILQATYGAGSQQIDVTAKVQSLVQSGRMNVRVENHLFGTDPSFGKTKTLSVLFSSNGVRHRTDIREGEPLSLPTSAVGQPNSASQTQATQTEAATSPGAPASPTMISPEHLTTGTALWLMQRMSVKTKTGIIGVLPGSKVTVTKDKGPR